MLTCMQARRRLPELLYGELPAAERQDLEKHLIGCPACRQEQLALQAVRRLLDAATPAPPVHVDLARLYGAAARRRRIFSWRRVAAGAAVAAALLLAFARLELRVEGHQLVLRWGQPPSDQPLSGGRKPLEPAPPMSDSLRPPLRQEKAAPAVSREDLELLRELVYALAEDAEVNAREQRQAVGRLQGRLDRLQDGIRDRAEATERLVSALTTVQLSHLMKGAKP